MNPRSAKYFAPLTLAILFFYSPTARAGFFEVGASGNYRKSNIDVDAYDESLAYTGSIAYYLSEASAIELSYTNGISKRAISENSANGHITNVYYANAGLDFIYTFGGKDSSVRPYIKGGTVYIISKRYVDQFRAPDGTLLPATTLEDTTGFAPSAGAGFRIGLTESLSFKVGVDGWASRPLNNPPFTIDWFGRAGLSLFF